MAYAELAPMEKTEIARKMDAAVWGLFFVWVGVALLAGIGWGVGLVGVGVIMLGGQVARRSLGLAVEGFWVVAGLFFALGGALNMLGVRVSLVPALLIAAGVSLLFGAVRATRG
ncbi:MAG: hypothetical protein AB7L66_10260 [Gemmatimonadales bacterium]